MLVKFFHRGTATSDSALSYLLCEMPLRYLSGARDRRGVIRDPAPAVVKGHPELTRQLINQCRNKHRYVSGVLSFERLISPQEEQEIIRLFERVAFSGLRQHQFDCLWIRHSHLHRTELHFLSARCELTSLRALNIHPPRQRREGMYDTFRKLINHSFNLKEPSGQRLSEPERNRLTKKLAGMVTARAAYNRRRYPVEQPGKVGLIGQNLYENRTRSSVRKLAATRQAIPRARPAIRPAVERLGSAARTFGQAGERLERASCQLGSRIGTARSRLAEYVQEQRSLVAGRAFFARYGIPEPQRVGASREIADEEIERERGLEL
jgi:hypothetical protein